MKKFVLVLLFLFMGSIQATTYYVDASAINDSGTGTTPTTAWKTINKVNSGPVLGYAANDIISFKCGQTFSGYTLTPPRDNLTFNSYSSGEKPIIDGQSIRVRSEVIKGHIGKNPFDHVNNLRVSKKVPDYYTQAELEAFFNQEMETEYRNAFTCFLNTGMRFEELANLTWEDVDLEKKLIKVQSKGEFRTKTFNSERSIPMTKPLLKLLKKLSVKKSSAVYPFPAPDGSKLQERKLLRICKEIGKAALITSRVYIHKFRHTFASHLVQRGVAIEAIQKLLGHSSIIETMVYACLKPEGLHEEISVLDNLMK